MKLNALAYCIPGLALALLSALSNGCSTAKVGAQEKKGDDKKAESPVKADAKVAEGLAPVGVRPGDWNQWGGSPIRNNTPEGKNIPTEWNLKKGTNVKWVSQLGSQTYGNPVVANGKVYVGTNNGGAWLKRYPAKVDLGVLLCFDEKDGKFLWQASSEKLPTGRVHDWPFQGICVAPLVEGERCWYVTSRGEVLCLDTAGFHDDENDGPFKTEKVVAKDEADVIWRLDMMAELGTSQHNMCSCSLTAVGDTLFVNTSNGVDEGHLNVPAPRAPSFLAVDKNTGKVLWSDGSPGINILHGQWSSPAYGVLGGVPQVLFAGGDGWLYSFDPQGGEGGKSKLLWKFDCNPKDSLYKLDGATRNHLIGTPVVYDGMVYIAVGEDPEHGEGDGHLWCIDPSKRGDVSPQLVFNKADGFKTPVPHKRLQACVAGDGDVARDNPNSAAVWHYDSFDRNQNGKVEHDETMHRTCGTVTIKDGLLYVADFSGEFHCLDAKTGKPHWTFDMLAASWSSALVVNGHVYIGDEDGDLAIFKHSANPDEAMKKVGKKYKPLLEIPMGNSVYTTPIVANNIIYIANKTHLFAIETGAQLKDPANALKNRAVEGSGD